MKTILLSVFLLSISILFGQEEIWIKPNKGQWHDNVKYKIGIPSGHLFLEEQGFTYYFSNIGELYHLAHEQHDENSDLELKEVVVKTKLLNANTNITFNELGKSNHYENYFLGNDSSKWASNVYLFNEIDYLNIYDGINLNVYEYNSTLKYDFIISPNINPNIIQISYNGQDNLSIIDGDLVVKTKLGSIIEKAPIAYQFINGLKKQVVCKFKLSDNIMSFDFPEGYDTSAELIIDPELAFSTFTGASSDNWGMTACPDINDNLIAGGIVFGSGYPLVNAFDGSINNPGNSRVDIGITKFNSTGSSLVFSTFIGGNGSETPHSLIVNNQNELYIMGATSSTDFPVSGSSYQNSHGGGPFSMTIDGINFNGGSDIYIFKLSAAGNSMLGSTYLGGSAADGISDGNPNIHFNYGDQLRGAIILDDNSNVYITSTTKSNNFPIIGGFDSSFDGGQDAIVAKLNSNLSSLIWSTYLGGSSWESGNSIQLSSNGDIYVVGGTTSGNFPNTSGQLNSSYKGGITDGYVTKFNAPLYNNPISSYLGTNEYDQAYLIDLDIDDNVYVYGQSEGSYPVTSGKYSNPNSGQFIHKLNTNLTSSIWSTVVGGGTGHVEISPTAFLISDCYEIYIAGWGGQTNVSNSSATFSSTNGFPVTADAYQPTTNGSNFYLALYTEDMLSLKYATFMGSLNGSNDHVDGGTSRFDKSGKVYHAVCAACGGNDNGFPTTSGVYSTTNNSNNCNLAAFLFELSKIEATLSTGTPITCIPNATQFDNTSQNGDTYEWIFGDGGTSNLYEPSHQYTDPGTYTVLLIVSDASGCYEPDTATIEVEVILPDYQVWALTDTICPGESVQVFATGGSGYAWGPPELFDDPSSASPFATINEATELTVDISSECGSSQLNITIYVFGTNATSGLDTAICVGGQAQLSAAGGETYNWSPPESLNDPTIASPIASPPITTYYVVEIITPEGCHIFDTTKVHVDQDIPFPNLIDEVTICYGDQIQITANGATDYIWSPNYNISAIDIYNPIVSPEHDTSYAVSFINACGFSYDTVNVYVTEVIGNVVPDTIICPEGTAFLWASGGVDYEWTPNIHLNRPHDSTTLSTPNNPITYSVLITDENGCSTTLSTYVDIFDAPTIDVSPNTYGIVGDTIPIWAEGNGSILWSPPQYINCVTCNTALVSPPNNFVYTATLTDVNTCTVSKDVIVNFEPLIYVPNAFTPDGDNYNNTFYAVANNIRDFEMLIFNRWGELIFISNSIYDVWDGSYAGKKSPDDVYVWKIKYVDLNGVSGQLTGHVTLLR